MNLGFSLSLSEGHKTEPIARYFLCWYRRRSGEFSFPFFFTIKKSVFAPVHAITIFRSRITIATLRIQDKFFFFRFHSDARNTQTFQELFTRIFLDFTIFLTARRELPQYRHRQRNGGADVTRFWLFKLFPSGPLSHTLHNRCRFSQFSDGCVSSVRL